MKAEKLESVEAAIKEENLPEGWAETYLSQVTETVPNENPRSEPSREFGYVDISSIDNKNFAIVDEKRFLGSEAPSRARRPIRPGDVLFSNVRTYLRNVAVVPDNCKAELCSTGFTVVRANRASVPEYLFYYLLTDRFIDAVSEQQTGSNYPATSDRKVLETNIPLPPLAEQHRIVAKIDELIAQVTTVRSHLERVPKILKRFRQSVLAAACSGRLTQDWREAKPFSSSAEVLVREIVSKRKHQLKQFRIAGNEEPLRPVEDALEGIPAGWVAASFDQITSIVTSGSRGWAKYYADSGPLFIRAECINRDRVSLEGAVHVKPPVAAEGRRTLIRFGDLLVTITGANVTKSALVDAELGEAYVSQHVALVRPVDPRCAEYMYFWCVSPVHGRAKLLTDAYGAGKPGLNLRNIKEMTLALPPLEEQQEIVRRVDALFKLAAAIEDRVKKATIRTDKLTQAVLAKAFRGELVPTEAELARQEGWEYETAAELLARIRVERGTVQVKQARKGVGRKGTSPRLQTNQATAS